MKQMETRPILAESRAWKTAVAPYQKPDLRRSLWQIVNTLVPYFLITNGASLS